RARSPQRQYEVRLRQLRRRQHRRGARRRSAVLRRQGRAARRGPLRPYVSKALGVGRTAWIYTPPGYDTGKDYPVMYLLHGAGDIESGWTMIGRANNILDNAIADGRVTPMVVVMPLGYATQSFWAGPAAASQAAAPSGPGALSLVGQDLLNDVMPMVERDYKVARTADKRAIAGLSMG